MVTISLCMIVKNEEQRLDKCLSSLVSNMDEIIIVDTGSTDKTKEIARKYTDKIYDYTWENDFSKARNFAASKATMDYIYTADADEYLEPEDMEQLGVLKQVLMPEVEIVQMLYCTKAEDSTVYNFQEELRPKLYKRVREFVWIDPIHETLRLDPVVFDSDIRIQHRPTPGHQKRDLTRMLQMFQEGVPMSQKLHHMYAMELYISGDRDDFIQAIPVFEKTMCDETRSQDEIREAMCILTRAYRLQEDFPNFLAYAMKDAVTSPTAELCCELGAYYEENNNLAEAALWYQNALSEETESILDIRTSREIPEDVLARLNCF